MPLGQNTSFSILLTNLWLVNSRTTHAILLVSVEGELPTTISNELYILCVILDSWGTLQCYNRAFLKLHFRSTMTRSNFSTSLGVGADADLYIWSVYFS